MIPVPDPSWNFTAQSAGNAQNSLSVKGNFPLSRVQKNRAEAEMWPVFVALALGVRTNANISYLISIYMVGTFKINQLSV